MIEVINPLENIGVIEPGSKSFINFEYKGKSSDIVFVRRTCGCTGEHTFLSQGDSNMIQFMFTEQDTQTLTKKHADDYYSNKMLPFTKKVILYLNDNLPLTVQNPDYPDDPSQKLYNTLKSQVSLLFSGFVDIRELYKQLV